MQGISPQSWIQRSMAETENAACLGAQGNSASLNNFNAKYQKKDVSGNSIIQGWISLCRSLWLAVLSLLWPASGHFTAYSIRAVEGRLLRKDAQAVGSQGYSVGRGDWRAWRLRANLFLFITGPFNVHGRLGKYKCQKRNLRTKLHKIPSFKELLGQSPEAMVTLATVKHQIHKDTWMSNSDLTIHLPSGSLFPHL